MVDSDSDSSMPRGGSTEPAGGRTLTRSEERLRVDTVRKPFQTARLERYVVTETRTIEVQVTREEVRVVYTPLDADGAQSADSAHGPAATGSPDRWMTISEEQAEVTTRIVPVARVRLETVWVDGSKDVTEPVRHEEIDLDFDGRSVAGNGQQQEAR